MPAITARIDATKAAIRDTVAACAPIVDPSRGFVSITDPRSGHRARLESFQEAHRFFEVVLRALPVHDRGSCRDRLEIGIRVRYERTGDIDPTETAMAEDVRAIACALRQASNWDQSTSGITSMLIGDPDVESLPDDDDPVFSIVSIPLTITIRSC